MSDKELEQETINTRCGHIALVGRPNVGKSTLLNHLIGQKLSITSRKPQTTRHSIRGIKTVDQDQLIYVDTPGLHQSAPKALQRSMNRVAQASLADVDVVLCVLDSQRWHADDDWVLQALATLSCPVIAVLNKIDELADKTALLPCIQTLQGKRDFHAIIPVSALKNEGLDALEKNIRACLPIAPHGFDAEQITDRSERFLVGEIVREKLMRQLGQELPYDLAVVVESFQHKKGIVHLRVLIVVEREGQKRIVIGEKGQRLKRVGQEARLDIERLLENKVMLTLWVSIKPGWSHDEKMLSTFVYPE